MQKLEFGNLDHIEAVKLLKKLASEKKKKANKQTILDLEARIKWLLK